MKQLSKEQFEELVKKLEKAVAYQRGAWAKVEECGRKYAQMKVFGSYNENGSLIRVGYNDRKSYEEMFRDNLLRACEDAFQEDAQVGVEFHQNLG